MGVVGWEANHISWLMVRGLIRALSKQMENIWITRKRRAIKKKYHHHTFHLGSCSQYNCTWRRLSSKWKIQCDSFIKPPILSKALPWPSLVQEEIGEYKQQLKQTIWWKGEALPWKTAIALSFEGKQGCQFAKKIMSLTQAVDSVSFSHTWKVESPCVF